MGAITFYRCKFRGVHCSAINGKLGGGRQHEKLFVLIKPDKNCDFQQDARDGEKHEIFTSTATNRK
jgi:hypothetical protein